MIFYYQPPSFKSLTVICIFLLIIVSPASSQSMLDFTFGNAGKVVTSINDTSKANDIAILPDGRIIVCGSTTINNRSSAVLVRYNTNGSLDNTFANNGKLVVPAAGIFTVNTIALQADGKIVSGGRANFPSEPSGNFNFGTTPFAIVRYKPNGNLDSLFGTNGIAKAVMTRGWGEVKKLLIKSDGKILTAGTVAEPTFENTPGLVQFNSNGSIDSSFGNNGKVEGYITIETETGYSDLAQITDIALDKDGKIYATAEMSNWPYIGDFTLLRFLPEGRLDSSFGKNGIVRTDFNDNSAINNVEIAQGIIILPDGSIVATGYCSARLALAKYKINGSLDSAFGNGGKVTTPVYNLNAYANDVATDAAGNLYVSGYVTGSGSNWNFVVAKYFANGRLDSSFGANGIDTTNFLGFSDIVYASAIQPDGKIILAGQAGENSNKYSIALARYSISTLPLKLLTLTVLKDGKTNLLQWTTAQEVNVERFEIERSDNGREYSSIGKMNAGLSKYNFIDGKPLPGRNCYRLKLIDRDGRFEYSGVRVVNNNEDEVSIYPVPARRKLTLQIKNDKAEQAQILVTDLSGKIMLISSVSLVAGVNTVYINIQSVNKGVYFLKIVTSTETQTRKILVD